MQSQAVASDGSSPLFCEFESITSVSSTSIDSTYPYSWGRQNKILLQKKWKRNKSTCFPGKIHLFFLHLSSSVLYSEDPSGTSTSSSSSGAGSVEDKILKFYIKVFIDSLSTRGQWPRGWANGHVMSKKRFVDFLLVEVRWTLFFGNNFNCSNFSKLSRQLARL